MGRLIGCDDQFPDVPITVEIVGDGLSNDLASWPVVGLRDDREANPLAGAVQCIQAKVDAGLVNMPAKSTSILTDFSIRAGAR